MSIRIIAALIAIVILPSVHASTVFNVQSITCPSFNLYELSGPLTISCAGDLSITGGEMSDDHAIKLTATGNLALIDMAISAPQIEIFAGNLTLGKGVLIAGSDAYSNEGHFYSLGSTLSIGGFIDLRPDADKALVSQPISNITPSKLTPISSLSEVPLPSSFVAFLFGILTVLLYNFRSLHPACKT